MRNCSLDRLPAVLAVAVAMGGGAVFAQPVISERFDSSLNGWGVYGDAAQVTLDSAGNPGNCMRARDEQASIVWGFTAGPAFLGDRSCLYGGVLSWQGWTTHTTAVSVPTASDVTIFGAGLTLVFDLPLPDANVWYDRSVTLTETAGWRKNSFGGAVPTEAEFRAALAGITAIQIRSEYSNTVDTGRLDNVVMASFLVSSPATVSVCPGEQVELAATVTVGAGNGPFAYAWRLNGELVDVEANPSAATAILVIASVTHGDAGTYVCDVSNACGVVSTLGAQVFVDPSDVGTQGGEPGIDGVHDNNDFIAFINLFFDQDAAADLGSQGGELGSDGLFDNNDFIAFINEFFSEC